MAKHLKKDSGNEFVVKLATYASSGLLVRLFRLTYAFAKPKFLSPADLGLWNLLALIPQYTTYLHLGTQISIVYRIPELIGQGGQEELIEQIKSTVYWFSFAVNFVFSVLLFLIAAFLVSEQLLRYGLLAIAVYNIINWYSEYQRVLLKAYQQFHIIVRANMIDAFVLLLLCVPLVAFVGIYGVFVGVIFSHLFSAFYMAAKNPLRNTSTINVKLLRDLIREGFPVLIFGVGLLLVTTSDRLIIGALLDREAVGYYAVAIVVAGFILQIPTSARDILEPQLMTRLSCIERDVIWVNYVYRPLLSTAFLFPLIWGPTAFLTEHGLEVLLPEYVMSAPAVIVIAHGVLFVALLRVLRGIVVVERLQTRSILPLGFGLILNVALGYYFLNLGLDIAGVAFASSFSFAVVFVIIFRMVLARSRRESQFGWRLIGLILAPLIYSVSAIAILGHVFSLFNLPALVSALAQLALYLIGAIAMILYVDSKFGGLVGPLRSLLRLTRLQLRK